MNTITESVCHAALVAEAAKWLAKKRCSVVITEISSAAWEHPDAIGWLGSTSILIECKASRSDFLADSKKPFRINPENGIGTHRYFLAPIGLISTEELPERWGLLELGVKGVRVARPADIFPAVAERAEIAILLSALRRVGRNAPAGVSIKCYTIETLNRATLGVEAERSLAEQS